MTPREAKALVASEMARHDATGTLTARTVSFEDLARASCVFVTVKGFKPGRLVHGAGALEAFARERGFRVQFA
jgi:hypothetical protein